MGWWQWRQQGKIRRRAWVSISKVHTEPTWQHVRSSGGAGGTQGARLRVGWKEAGWTGGWMDRWADR